MDEIWQAYETLIRQGKVVYAGSSNFAGWDIATACQEASKRGMQGLVSEQSKYSLADRMVELEVIPACRHYGLGLLPYSPLSGGLLGGRPKQGEGLRRSGEGYEKKIEKHRQALDAYEAFCKKLGETPARVALAWLLHNPVVAAPIIGPSRVEQLEDAVAATEILLGEADLRELDAIWPGPGGEAPTAYAW
jgi:aryl-alcohol dehydrogenase-like predicted oxidoreductase